MDDLLSNFEKSGAVDERDEFFIKGAAAAIYGGASDRHSQLHYLRNRNLAGAETVSCMNQRRLIWQRSI